MTHDRMKTSDKGLKLIREWEGCVLKVYADVAGYSTIGIGHLIRDGENFGLGITEDEAMALLAEDVVHAENCVNNYVKVGLTQGQFDVLVDFVFNVGGGAFRRSTLLRLLNDGDHDAVPHQLLRWKMAGGKVVQGLINRRKAGGKVWRAASLPKPRKKPAHSCA